MNASAHERRRLFQNGSRAPLLRRVSSFSISVSNLVKETFEHSLPAYQIRAKRVGLGCALLCALLGSIKGWMVSELAGLGPAEIFGLRSIGTLSFLIPILVFRNSKLVFDFRTNLILALRSLVGNVAVAGYYYGFAYLPLAEASLIFYSTPIYTTLIGWLCLRERCDYVQFISLLLCFAGVALVSSPTLIYQQDQGGRLEFTESLQGVTGCLVGALAQAVAMIILRKLNHVSAGVVSFWWALTGAAACLGLKGMFRQLVPWSCGWQAGLVIGMMLTGFLSELLMVAALHLEEAGPVSVALTSEILWALALQAGLQEQLPTLLTLFGALFILSSMVVPAVCTACRRWLRERAWRTAHRKDYEKIRTRKESVVILENDGY